MILFSRRKFPTIPAVREWEKTEFARLDALAKSQGGVSAYTLAGPSLLWLADLKRRKPDNFRKRLHEVRRGVRRRAREMENVLRQEAQEAQKQLSNDQADGRRRESSCVGDHPGWFLTNEQRETAEKNRRREARRQEKERLELIRQHQKLLQKNARRRERRQAQKKSDSAETTGPDIGGLSI